MAINLDRLKSKTNELNSKGGTTSNKLRWSPKPGVHVVRMVPYKFDPTYPFIERQFHYFDVQTPTGVQKKTILSPRSFNRPDPIAEFGMEIRKSGKKEDYELSKKYIPRSSYFIPIIVRGEEKEGVRYWGLNKTLFLAISSVIQDPEWGDISDLAKGHDIRVTCKSAKEIGKDYNESTILISPKETPAVDPKNKELMEMLGRQTNVDEIWTEMTYDELHKFMEDHLSGKPQSASTPSEPKSTPSKSPVASTAASALDMDPESPSAEAATDGVENMEAEFNDIFSNKK